MGMYDFVQGIFVGIGLAALALVVQTSRVPAIRASYSGEIAGSTVRRNPTQWHYLRAVGQQIHVTKLAGYLFFGTIVSVEDRLRTLIQDDTFADNPIRFLVLDLFHVSGIDYSAAEAFSRISRIFSQKNVTLYVSGVKADGPLGSSLISVGLLAQDGIEVRLFEDLNSALESCENELLKTFYASRDARSRRRSMRLEVPSRDGSHEERPAYTIDAQFSSPRFNHLQRSALSALEQQPVEIRYHNFKEPLKLILQTFQGLTEKNEDFWYYAIPFFQKKEYAQGTVLYNRGESAKGFYLLEEGILRADYELPQGRYFESIVAGTTCGELPFFSDTDRTATVQAERNCVTWLLSRRNWIKLQEQEPDVATELLRISLKLTSERMSAITSYVLTTAG
jgi:SulP family sulfate permease